MRKHEIKIAMLSTGEEVLQGDIDDTNASWLSARLFELGLMLHRRVTVGDEIDAIVAELIACSQVSDVVIVNGGLGPTSDDVTAEAMAAAMKTKLVLNKTWFDEMQQFFQRSGRQMPQSNLKQAMLPQGAGMIFNQVGTACGFKALLNGCWFYFTPGVPTEFKHMIENAILPELLELFQDAEKTQLQRFYTFGLSESLLNDKFNALDLPSDCRLGYRSAIPFIEVKLFAPREQNIAELSKAIKDIIGSHLVSTNQTMLNSIAALLSANNISLAIFEPFTAGFLSSWLSEHPTFDTLLKFAAVTDSKRNRISSLSELVDMVANLKTANSVSIALTCQQIKENVIGIAMAADKANYACEIEFSRKLGLKEQKQYISTFMLDMLRRYLDDIEVIVPAGPLQILQKL